jgi:biotin operon repressor
VDDRRERFADGLADLLAAWNLPRATGRVYAALLLSDAPVTLDALQDETGLSKGQTSTSVRELASWGLARTTTRHGGRRLYVEAEAGLDTLLDASHRRARLFIAALRGGEELVPADSTARDRLQDVVALFDGYVAAGEQILARRRDVGVPRATPSPSDPEA